MSFYKELKDKHGENITRLFKKLDKQHSKLAGYINRKNFLLNCRRWHVLPKSIRINFGNIGQDINQHKFNQLANKFLFSIMNEKICIFFKDITTIKKDINHLIERISLFPISTMDLTSYLDKIKLDYEKNFEKRKAECLKKFKELKDDLVSTIVVDSVRDSSSERKHLINLTDVELSTNVKSILSLGPKFNMPTDKKKTPYDDIIADLETGIISVEDEGQRNILRNGISNILLNHKRSTKLRDTLQDKVLKLGFIETRRFLHDHPDILLTKADKGNVSVLMLRSDYDSKILSLLDDIDTYEVVRRHSSEVLQRNINALIEKWRVNEYISNIQAKKLKSYNSTVSKIYGLPKVHKEDFPLRPIVCSINAPTYNLSNFFSSILKNVVGKTSSFVKDSIEFKTFLSDLVVPDGNVFISLDVKSLFTNVDSKLIIDCVSEKWRIISKHTSLPLNDFKEGLLKVLDNCFFSYKDVTYRQLFGTPMGSPVSPVVSNLVMESIEDEILSSLDFDPFFYKRYVDDIIMCIPSEKIDYVFRLFNSRHPRLKFTIEYEESCSLSFLELLLIRRPDGRIITDWYHKETWSGRYLNFKSHLPISYKRNTVTLLTKKILQLSDFEFQEKNFNILRSTLVDNAYPQSFLICLIESERQKFLNSDLPRDLVPTVRTENFSKKFLSIPFIDDIFYKIKAFLKRFDIDVIGKSSNDLYKSLFSKLKDKTPIQVRSSVVYKINCHDCDLVYIGNTMQFLKNRVGQHKSAVNKNNVDHSALAEHAITNAHSIDWSNYEVIATENRLKPRQILEMIHIKKFRNNCMNRQIESQDLTNVYDSLFCT
jgi:hypothetical protein